MFCRILMFCVPTSPFLNLVGLSSAAPCLGGCAVVVFAFQWYGPCFPVITPDMDRSIVANNFTARVDMLVASWVQFTNTTALRIDLPLPRLRCIPSVLLELMGVVLVMSDRMGNFNMVVVTSASTLMVLQFFKFVAAPRLR